MAVEESVDLGAEETYVPSLDDGDGDVEVSEESTDDSEVEGVEQPAEEQPAADGKWFDDDDLNTRVAAAAKRIKHLDPNNPEHLKTLRSFVEKDRMAEKAKALIKAGNFDPSNPEHVALAKELLGSQGEESDPEPALTEFEKSLSVEPEAKATTAPAEAKPAAASAAAEIDDPGVKWTGPEDGLSDLSAAWSEIQEATMKAAEEGRAYKPDFSKVNKIEVAILDRRLEAMVAPVIEELNGRIEKIVERFGGVLPEVEKNVAQQRLATTKSFAVAELQKTGQYENIDKMFTATDGPPITINGEKFSNTPFHKAVAKAPWIMDIRKQGKDQQATASLTMIARLRAAHQVLQGAQPSKENAKRAIEAGQKLEARNREDRTRQTLNSGTGTNSFESSSKKGGYMSELMESDGEISISSL